jgi:hypothetical protein
MDELEFALANQITPARERVQMDKQSACNKAQCSAFDDTFAGFSDQEMHSRKKKISMASALMSDVKMIQQTGDAVRNGPASEEQVSLDELLRSVAVAFQLKTKLRPWDLSVTSHCSSNHIWQQQHI